MDKYPTHRCVECTLVRVYYSNDTCDECRYHAGEVEKEQDKRPKCNMAYDPRFHPLFCGCTAP